MIKKRLRALDNRAFRLDQRMAQLRTEEGWRKNARRWSLLAGIAAVMLGTAQLSGLLAHDVFAGLIGVGGTMAFQAGRLKAEDDRLNGRGQLNRLARRACSRSRQVSDGAALGAARRGAVDARRLAQAAERWDRPPHPGASARLGSVTELRARSGRLPRGAAARARGSPSRAPTCTRGRGRPTRLADPPQRPPTGTCRRRPRAGPSRLDPRCACCRLTVVPTAPASTAASLIAGQMHQHAAVPQPAGSGPKKPGAAPRTVRAP